MSSETIAYLAGIIDGEGYIDLRFVNGTLMARLEVSNTNEDLIDWLVEHFGGSSYSYAGRSPRHKVAYRWVLQGKAVRDLLIAVLPYLVVKVEQAEIVIEFWEVKAQHGIARFCRATPAYLRDASPLVEAIRILNRFWLLK